MLDAAAPHFTERRCRLRREFRHLCAEERAIAMERAAPTLIDMMADARREIF